MAMSELKKLENKSVDTRWTQRVKEKRLRAENQLLSLLTCGMDGTIIVRFHSII